MANKESAKKRIRQNEKRRIRNRTVRTKTRTTIKQARIAIESGEKELAAEQVHLAIKQLDRAASKGVIHKKNAARRKKRLMLHLNALDREPAAEA